METKKDPTGTSITETIIHFNDGTDAILKRKVTLNTGLLTVPIPPMNPETKLKQMGKTAQMGMTEPPAVTEKMLLFPNSGQGQS